MEYVDSGASCYEERYRQLVLNTLTRRAESFSVVLQAKPARGEGVSQEVCGLLPADCASERHFAEDPARSFLR